VWSFALSLPPADLRKGGEKGVTTYYLVISSGPFFGAGHPDLVALVIKHP